ncbi:MAG: hypothetical protein H7839_09780 [Magnetococcus sp. YQC-5]
MNRIILGLIACVLTLSGCANTPVKKISAEQLSQFKEGKTTYNEVVTLLGQPTSVDNNSDGSKVVQYFSQQINIDGTTYIPFVNMFARGGDVATENVIFQFDTKGVLMKYSSSSSKQRL